MEFSKKQVFRISIIYGIIVIVANVVGTQIPSLLQSPGIRSVYMDPWIQYLSDYSYYTTPVQLLTYVLPTFLCILYSRTGKKGVLENRLINLPIAYASIGVSGWGLYLTEEFILLLVATKLGYNIDLLHIIPFSTIYVILEATIAFTLSFYLMDLCHRKFFFPKFYPDGYLNRIEGTKHPSLRTLFCVNYLSVTFFPVAFTFIAFTSFLDRHSIELDYMVVYLLLFIIIIGIIITFSFQNSIEKPINKLKDRIKLLNNGDYKSKVRILSNDDFGELGDIFNEMTESIDNKTQKIIEIQDSVLESMAIMVESRDNSTGGHIKRTSECVKVFVHKLKSKDKYKNISEHFYESVIKAAPMHDLGKIAVDDAILRKPEKFTDEEYEKMKAHSAEGAKIVSEVLHSVDDEEFKKIAINVAHYHHEKWNGQGYPNKIAGEEIPLEARIMALADVFDALVSKRCYKDCFPFNKAFQIIEESLGSHFDAELGKVFIECRPELEDLYSRI